MARFQNGRSVFVTQIDSEHYPEITVYVRVTEASGIPVGGLSAADFSLTEQGSAMALTRVVVPGQSPLSAVLVIDHSGSMEDAEKLAGAKEAARAFVAQMRPGDRTALVAFSDAPLLLQPFTDDQGALRKAIGPLRPDGSTALYDGVAMALRQLEFAPGRRSIILLTDGRDRISLADPRPASSTTLDQAITTAVSAGVPILSVGLGEPGNDGRDGIDQAVLQRIANETGGTYVPAPTASTLTDIYRELASGLQQEYALTYRSPLPVAAPRREIRVVVGALAESTYQPTLLPPQREPDVPLALLPIAAVPIALGAILLWRSRRMRERAPRPTPAIGATVALNQGYCIECGKPLPTGVRFCQECGAPVEVQR
jgi:Ca-activated chloride channel family protein